MGPIVVLGKGWECFLEMQRDAQLCWDYVRPAWEVSFGAEDTLVYEDLGAVLEWTVVMAIRDQCTCSLREEFRRDDYDTHDQVCKV